MATKQQNSPDQRFSLNLKGNKVKDSGDWFFRLKYCFVVSFLPIPGTARVFLQHQYIYICTIE